jgi:hypothetical protein
MTGKLFVRIALVIVVAAVLLPAVLSACPLCKDAKADTDYPGGSASLPKGFYYSILLMVSAPFAVTGGLIFRIYLARRQARGLPASAAAPSEAVPALAADRSAAPLVPDPRGARP